MTDNTNKNKKNNKLVSSDKVFTFEEMEKLAHRISKIKNKNNLEAVRDIILTCNPGLSVTQNTNGLFMCFHNLTNETYNKLSTYIKKIKVNSNSLSDTSENAEYKPYTSNEYPFEGNAKLRYSNKEKNLIKRKMYDKQIKINNQDNNINQNTGEVTFDFYGVPGNDATQVIQKPIQNSVSNIFIKHVVPTKN
jgi:hypothetical protein